LYNDNIFHEKAKGGHTTHYCHSLLSVWLAQLVQALATPTRVRPCEQEVRVRYSREQVADSLASDANDPGSTPGGTIELDTGYHPFVGR